MLINYYAPGTSWEFRMWAADQITTEFPMAYLVAVHDQDAPNQIVNCWVENSRNAIEYRNVKGFTHGLFQRWIRGGFSLSGTSGIETAS